MSWKPMWPVRIRPDRRRAKGPSGKRGSRRGFTLVEMILVIFILSILLTIMLGTYRNIVLISRTVTPAIREREKAVLTLELIRNTINRAYYFKDTPNLLLKGSQGEEDDYRMDTLTFAAIHPEGAQQGLPEIREVSFYVKANKFSQEREGVLMRREDNFVDDKPGQGGIHYPLLEHVTSLTFGYSMTGKRWSESWDTRKTGKLPRFVRIRLTVQSRGQKYQYESLASPGLAMEL